MDQAVFFLLGVALTIGLFIAPVTYGIYLWIGRPAKAQATKYTAFWRRFLWCIACAFYGIFAIYATFYLALKDNPSYAEIAIASLTYVLPWVYIVPSLKTYNLTNKGLLLLFGIDVCDIDRGFWFVPEFIGEVVKFTVSLQEYQFPADSVGEEHDAEIRISTGQHLVTHHNKADKTIKTSLKRASDLDTSEEGVLTKIIMLIVSPMVVFRFIDARKLFVNFSDIYESDGETGVSAEIARQIRDHIVSEATSLFPRYTAEEIFHKMDEINAIIWQKVLHDVSDWGIELLKAKLTTVTFDKSIEKYLDDVVKQNTEAIGHLLEAQKESEAYRLFTQVRKERADAMAGPNGDMLRLVFQLETAAQMAAKSTNYNIGNFDGFGLTGILKQILEHKN